MNLVAEAKKSKFAKSTLMGEIDSKVNDLASQVFSPQRFEVFKSGDLDCRVALLGMVASAAGEDKVAEACNEWFKIIND